MRIESDGLGTIEILEDAAWGCQTQRAINNFPLSGYRMHRYFIQAFAYVKKAAAQVNMNLGYLDGKMAEAIIQVCDEIITGEHHDQFVLDAFQGGAGTSTNMNFNEVIAYMADKRLTDNFGSSDPVLPLEHVNMHQSTNDVYPTAVRVAILFYLKDLEREISSLQEEFQKKEKEFSHVVKLGRTELMDAVPLTLGMEFGAYAEAIARDRWRIFKCRERIKVINLGGTAIGTGLGAPREYIFKVGEALRSLTGLSISRSENLVDATQNLDPIVEISGMLKTYASNLLKISNDLRLMNMGPDGGIAEIRLPEMQAGSTIMPGKINPVIPEAIGQVALRVIANDNLISIAAGLGQLELNQYFPLIAFTILETLHMLVNASAILRDKCLISLQANEDICLEHVINSKTLATILVPVLGYYRVEAVLKEAVEEKRNFRELLLEKNLISQHDLDTLLSAKQMRKLGFTEEDVKKDKE
ncbi:MAG TPA: aspartate ammonia-lyase [Candidatus Cloacimonadota bacterium]|nr:aspartate ammonia-lyase [Candidatus Cloacimonadota bacterium]